MIIFETSYLRYVIDEKGNNVEFTEKATARNVLKDGFNPCSKIVKSEDDRTEIYPESVSYSAPYLNITYTDGHSAKVLVTTHEHYLTFELVEISDENFWSIAAVLIETDVDYNTDSSFVSTLMGMTLKTRMLEYPGRNRVLLAEGYTHVGISPVKAAVIGAPEKVLNSIMREVVAEIPDGTMPKAAYSGPYACECRDAERTYTIDGDYIMPDEIDEYINKLNTFGISQVNLHQYNMFRHGDFAIGEKYPNGAKDFKAIIDKFHENGIQVMLHSYAFFVQAMNLEKGNKYLAPIPHRDLRVWKRFTLARDLLPEDSYLPILEPTDDISPFGPASRLLWIDDEIIRFEKTDDTGFVNVERGVYGSTITPHTKDSEVKQLGGYFGYIAPEKGSELFYEIARNTADFYNEFDFDGFYLDAIDGVFVLDGHEFAWYHAVDFINEMFKYLKKPPIFNCCYGPQYPGQWYARTRMGAFDTPHRGYRDFTDVHVDFNSKFAERMYLIGELGWWALIPNLDDKLGWLTKVMYDEDIDYICSKILATDVCQCWHGSFKFQDKAPILLSYADKIQLYTKLKREQYFDKRIKDVVRRPYSEHELTLVDGKYFFRPTFTDYNKIQSFDDGRNTFKVNNRFDTQKPKIRIECLFTADNYDSTEGKLLCDMDETKTPVFNEPISIPNVDTEGKRGIGVWVCGDGSGQVINFRFNSPSHKGCGNSDHFVRADFTGWRYYSFYEVENCEMKHEDFEPQGLDYKIFTDVRVFYAAYFHSPNYSDIDRLTIMVKDPESCNIKVRPIKALPHREVPLTDPTITVNGKSVTFKTTMPGGSFMEYDPETGIAKLFDGIGNLLDTPEIIGDAPILEAGENTVTLSDSSTSEYQKRASVTFRTHGDIIE